LVGFIVFLGCAMASPFGWPMAGAWLYPELGLTASGLAAAVFLCARGRPWTPLPFPGGVAGRAAASAGRATGLSGWPVLAWQYARSLLPLAGGLGVIIFLVEWHRPDELPREVYLVLLIFVSFAASSLCHFFCRCRPPGHFVRFHSAPIVWRPSPNPARSHLGPSCCSEVPWPAVCRPPP
jgi:hypothetical protein